MNRIKLFTLISVFCLLLIIPTSFAVDGESAVAIDEPVENLTLIDDSDILASDYYFDSNNFSSSSIVSNSILHLANGEYDLDSSKTINNVTIIGQDCLQTILRCQGKTFTVSSSLILKNLTLINLKITNNGNLSASNTIFKDSHSSSSGGVITADGAKYRINLDNCTFNNTSARYAGAIYIRNSTLTITNSLFINNHADLYGGSIVGYDNAKINIEDTTFLNDYSVNDAGGAIYLFKSELISKNLQINNCSSTFGGAITSLQSSLDLKNFIGRNNKAKYDGGAIYARYRYFHMSDSILENNSAFNAGAIFVYSIDDFLVKDTQFIDNNADNSADAFYSIYLNDTYYDSILDARLHNTLSENDVLEVDLPDLFIGNGNVQLYNSNSSYISSLPSSYDLRQLGQVSSIENQGSDGNCWAFATLAALESSILKVGGSEFDFSEQNMKNLMSRYSAYGWQMDTNDGGYSKMGYGYLVSWLGPVNESDDEYDEGTVLSPVLDSLMHVQNVLFLKRDNYTDNDEIKLAIMNYGAVATPMCYYNAYLKNGKYYYYPYTKSANHLVAIVGWDDDLQISGAPGKGAWIAKNSWGTNWGENGYFYVSYYDTKFAQVGTKDSFVFILNDTIKYDKNYQYDIPGITDYFFSENNVSWYKNKFTATDNEYLGAVSTYFDKNTNWDLAIYVNDNLRLTQSGFATPSYKTIELDQFIQLNKGDVFEVVFKVSVDGDVGVPISEFVSLNTEFYTWNISYISFDGYNWLDLYNLTWSYPSHSYASQVACIKAFTVLDTIKTSINLEVADSSNLAKIKAIVKNQYGNLVNSGKVTFTIDGNDIVVDVVNGVASLTYLFNTFGNKIIIATFSATGFDSSNDTVNVVVNKISTSLFACDITTSYGSGDELVVALKDAYGNPIGGGELVIALGDINMTVVTNSNGEVRFDVSTLAPGIYYTTIYFAGHDDYNQSILDDVVVTVKMLSTVLTAPDVVALHGSGDEIVATLTDSNDKVLSKARVYITVDGVKHTLTSDSNGQVRLSTAGLGVGNYVALVQYKGTTRYRPTSTTLNVIIFDKIDTSLDAYDITTSYGSGGEFVATLSDANGDHICGADVVICIGDVNVTVVTDDNGEVRFDVSTLAPGVYYATIYFTGNYVYNPAVLEDVVVTVTMSSTVLTAPDVIALYGSGDEIVATLTDSNGKALAKARVYITIDGVKHTLTSDSNGQVKLSTEGLSVGDYTALVQYKGTTRYRPTTKTLNVVIIADKFDTSLLAPGVTTSYGSGGELVATLTDANGNPIVGAEVVIALADINMTVVTNSNGEVSLDVSTLAPGTYYATISFADNNVYNPAVLDGVVVTVTMSSTVLTALDVVAVYGSGDEIVATLTDSNGKALNKARVYITIDGVKHTLTTDSNGQVKLSTDGLSIGDYTALVQYKGTTRYRPTTKTLNVVIIADKFDTSFVVGDITVSYCSGGELVATLTDANDNPIVGAEVVVALGDINMTVVTNSNGEVSLDVSNLAPGTYYATVYFAGNKIYNQAVLEGVVVTVTMSSTVLTAPDVVAVCGSGDEIVATLTDSNGKVLNKARVYITIDGVKHTLTTDSNGQVRLSTAGLSVGDYTASVQYKGTTCYRPTKKSAIIQIIS